MRAQASVKRKILKLAGTLLDRYLHKRCFLMFVYFAAFGFVTCLTPLMGSVYALLAVSVIYGLSIGAFHAGDQKVVLQSIFEVLA